MFFFFVSSQQPKQTDHRRSSTMDHSDSRPRRSGAVVVRLHRDDPRIQLLPHWSDKFNSSVKLATRVLDAGLCLPPGGVVCKSSRLSSVEGKDVYFCLSPSSHKSSQKHSDKAPSAPVEAKQSTPLQPPSPPSGPSRNSAAKDSTPPRYSSEMLDFPVEVTTATFIEC